MTLLREIQDMAASSDMGLPTLLRKTKILGARLGNGPLRRWVDHELDGYRDEDALPDYRIVRTASYGDFYGPFGSGVKNAQIPLLCLPEEWREWATTVHLRDGVSSYVATLNSASGKNLRVLWAADYVALAQSKVMVYEDMVLGSAWRLLPPSAIAMMLDTVRNRVLNFALEIEAEAPEAGEAPPGEPPLPQDVVTSIVNNTIILGGSHNVTVGSSDVSQNVTHQVRPGDFDSLRRVLRSLGLDDADLDTLEAALKHDPPPDEPGRLGQRTQRWLGDASRKIAAGSGSAAVSAAGQVLGKALGAYLGLE